MHFNFLMLIMKGQICKNESIHAAIFMKHKKQIIKPIDDI